MKKSVIAKGKRAKSSVWRGTKQKTVGGLTKANLRKNKRGKVVSAKASNRAKNSKAGKRIAAWGAAVKAARKQLGIKGFKPVKKGSVRYFSLLVLSHIDVRESFVTL